MKKKDYHLVCILCGWVYLCVSIQVGGWVCKYVCMYTSSVCMYVHLISMCVCTPREYVCMYTSWVCVYVHLVSIMRHSWHSWHSWHDLRVVFTTRFSCFYLPVNRSVCYLVVCRGACVCGVLCGASLTAPNSPSNPPSPTHFSQNIIYICVHM